MSKPNVIFIIMDDLCYGDLSCHANPHTNTRNLDKLHDESTRLTRYCTGPLCSPARASVMTGRYHLRTRVIDTYCGRSMIDPDEITLAKIFKENGYQTGAFGKWHLGDCYPLRAMDLGFDETLMHNGGGIGQPGDHHENWYREVKGEESYFNPVLHKNGVPVKTEGYCTDIFTSSALDFIDKHQDEPFFIYLATNAPHSPLQIGDEWADKFRKTGMNETHSRLYGMVENIDMNVGRIMDKLDERALSDNTILVYTSDHGPCGSARDVNAPQGQQDRYNAGLRGIKGTMYEGGIKVPCFWRWPKGIPRGKSLDQVSHAIDVMPTLLDACGIRTPENLSIDGISLLPAIREEQNSKVDRNLFMQWHRGNVPIRHRNYAVINQRYKLYRPHENECDELYDLASDLFEAHDIAAEKPELVEDMRGLYDEWLNDVASTRGQGTFDNPLIHIGTPYENPTVLTQNDMRLIWGQEAWVRDDLRSHWDVFAPEEGDYDITLRFRLEIPSGNVVFKAGALRVETRLEGGAHICQLHKVHLPKGKMQIEAWIETDEYTESARFGHFISAMYVELKNKLLMALD